MRPSVVGISGWPDDLVYMSIYISLGYKKPRIVNLKNKKNSEPNFDATGDLSNVAADPKQIIFGILGLGCFNIADNFKNCLERLRISWPDIPQFYSRKKDILAVHKTFYPSYIGDIDVNEDIVSESKSRKNKIPPIKKTRTKSSQKSSE